MPSYNRIDGQPSHASVWLLRDILRKEWGYQGLTVSDYFGNRELITRHRLAADNREATIRALLAGVDVETPDPRPTKELPALVREGQGAQALIDEAVRRVLSFKFEAGLFENPMWTKRPPRRSPPRRRHRPRASGGNPFGRAAQERWRAAARSQEDQAPAGAGHARGRHAHRRLLRHPQACRLRARRPAG